MMTTLLAGLLAAAPLEAAQSVPAEAPSEAVWALQLRTGTPALSFSFFQAGAVGGLGGIGGFGMATAGPSVGLFAERAIAKHWSAELGLSGSAGQQLATPGSTFVSFAAAPSLKWYAGGALDGGFIGFGLPLSLAVSSQEVTLGDGPHAFRASTFAMGAECLAGWTFRWSNRFLASAGIGPSLSWASSASSVDGSAAGAAFRQQSLGLRSFVGLGVAL